MRVLLVIGDPHLRDQVTVGLEAFKDIAVEVAEGLLALDKLRRTELDAVLIELGPSAPENEQLLEQFRAEALAGELILVGHDALTDRLREEKLRGKVFSFFTQPLDPVDFFRTINRLRQKRAPARAR